MKYTQENRFIKVDTPLGKDVLLLKGFEGKEGLSRPFLFELFMISEDHQISFEQIIGKPVTIVLGLPDGERYFNGIVSKFSQGSGGGENGSDLRFSNYFGTIVPEFWLLTLSKNSRIFQKKTVPQIIKQIFSEKGQTNYKTDLKSNYEPRDYCVQYKESDFDFISRLMEDEGIYYFYEHNNGKHTMILTDFYDTHKPCPKQEKAKYQITEGGKLKEDVILSLEKVQEIKPNKYSVNDYNYETPNTFLEVNINSKIKLGSGEREIYEHSGKYKDKNHGNRIARIRMEEQEANITQIKGISCCRAFTSGYRFSLYEHYRSELNQEYLLTKIKHKLTEGGDYPSKKSHNENESLYVNHFTCIPFDIPFRPKRKTKKPVVQGNETAIVVGRSGEKIYTDNEGFGRVKVQFHWDRDGKYNDNSSCWVRVAQDWAGKNWGKFFLPRVGQEVLVSFIEGDPDHPIIVKSVYNAVAKPPNSLPVEKTMSTIKTLSLKDSGFNEISFDDKKNEEMLFIHAEKNQNIRTKNDRKEWVGNDYELIVDGDQNKKINGNISLIVEKDVHQKINNNYAMESAKEIHLKAGQKVIIEAGSQISLKVGGAFIDISGSQISIKAPMIHLNSGGNPGSGSGASPKEASDPINRKTGSRALIRTG